MLLALFTLTRAWQSYYSRRGYWLIAFGAIVTVASLFVAPALCLGGDSRNDRL